MYVIHVRYDHSPRTWCVFMGWMCREGANRECFLLCAQLSDREVTVLIIHGAVSRMWLHKLQINGFFLWSFWPYAHNVTSCQGPDFLRLLALQPDNRAHTFTAGCDCSCGSWSNAYVTSKCIWKDVANSCLIALHFPIIHRCRMRVSSHWLVPTH